MFRQKPGKQAINIHRGPTSGLRKSSGEAHHVCGLGRRANTGRPATPASIGRRHGADWMENARGRAMKAGGRAIKLGGRAIKAGRRAMKVGGLTMKVGERAMKVGGRAIKVGWRAMKVGGRAMEVGGRSVKVSGRTLGTISLFCEQYEACLLGLTCVGLCVCMVCETVECCGCCVSANAADR